jgi:hypothetical protein
LCLLSAAAVGAGAAYLEMMLQVMALGHPLIVVECSSVAMRLGAVATTDEVVEKVVGILDKLNVEEACVIGHSYGECAGWVLGYSSYSACLHAIHPCCCACLMLLAPRLTLLLGLSCCLLSSCRHLHCWPASPPAPQARAQPVPD